MSQSDFDREKISLEGASERVRDVQQEELKGVFHGQEDSGGMVRFVMKCSGGLIKNEKQANIVLLVFVVAVIIVSLFLVFGGGEKSLSSPEIPSEIPRSFNFL